MKIALICGVTGQDGGLLAKFLIEKGYKVYGSSRDAQINNHQRLNLLGITDQIKLVSMDIEDFRSVYEVINRCRPNEIYQLAGQSSVGLSFEIPSETIRSFALGTLNILEACRMMKEDVKLYHAGSSECFGDTEGLPADETTKFQPKSPYGVAKASAHWLVNNYRESYGIYACTGILFNHESPLRPEKFVTQKIVKSARRIKNGSSEKLKLGRLDVIRDWGWAPEYVQAMWLMLQQSSPEDYVIATGTSHSLEYFVKTTFDKLGLNWTEHVSTDTQLIRPTDIKISRANPTKAMLKLGWKHSKELDEIIECLLIDNYT